MKVLVYFLLTFLLSVNQSYGKYFCRTKGWILREHNGVSQCFGGVGAVLRSELEAKCLEKTGVPLNIISEEMADDVLFTMVNINPKYYATWIHASRGENGYVWTDNREIPGPLNWCAGAKKTENGVVLICPFPKYDTFSRSTCCISDRQVKTKLAAICVKQATLDSCQITISRALVTARFTLLRSEVISGFSLNDDAAQICCNKCINDENCSAFNFKIDSKTCDFYKVNNEFVIFSQDVSNIANTNIYSGLKLSMAEKF